MNKTAIITGITGQDGSYLAELLLTKNYKVIGLYRKNSTNNFSRLNHILDNDNLQLIDFNMDDPNECYSIFDRFSPDEFYNLAAQSYVGDSYKYPYATFNINTMSTISLLESLRKTGSPTRFFHASSSEMYGNSYSLNDKGEKFQDENTDFCPQSPYGVSKLSSHKMIQIYRESYSLYVCGGILFNHESPRRSVNFVTRKITSYIGKLVNNLIPNNVKLKLGNINGSRDWGHASDYVKAMHLMLQQNKPDDYVISSGKSYTIKEFLYKAFKLVNKDYNDYVVIDPKLYRPSDIEYCNGNNKKAKYFLGWKPELSFDDLIEDMVTHDIMEYNNVSKLQ